jgi:hypothetical protein
MTEAGTEAQERLPRGVSRTAWGNRFFVQIRRHGKRHYLGTFADPEEAGRMYERAAAELDG